MKLKHLLENSTEHAYTPLTIYEKKKMYETIKSYNEYRKNLKAESVYETANKIMEAVNLAERYALKECGDWMQENTAIRHFKELKKMSEAFKKNAAKCQQQNNEMVSLYEDMGNILEKYFEIKSN